MKKELKCAQENLTLILDQKSNLVREKAKPLI